MIPGVPIGTVSKGRYKMKFNLNRGFAKKLFVVEERFQWGKEKRCLAGVAIRHDGNARMNA